MKRFITAAFLLALPAFSQQVTVDVTPGHATNFISPLRALGAGIDRDPLDSVKTIFDPAHVDAMLSAGWGAVTYRLNTELGAEAWHWNPVGTWSDPSGRGYFVGEPNSSGSIRRSFGYFLPHNGNTGSFLGYGVLDDGDLSTYWKSNPYLTQRYTHEDDSLHPQWIMIDLGSPMLVNAIRIAWANPYAVSYQVQYWTGDDAIYDQAHGVWKNFPGGAISDAQGGTVTLPLSKRAIKAEFIRVQMTLSSNTCDTHGSADLRNCVGYAINEVYLGTIDATGDFHDLLTHSVDGSQTATYCSSVDPWHRPKDFDPYDGEQPGFDLVYHTQLLRGLPMTVPVPMLYDNSENAANEIAYLKARGYPIRYIEMGEEPDGQLVLPEDDAALYIQWAGAIHSVDPHIKLAGPVFQGVNDDIPVWRDANGNTSWFTRFLNYLRSHGHLGDLKIMTFEHYPFDPCGIQWNFLYQEPDLVRHIMQVWRKDGLPESVPMEITESNLSWNANPRYMQTFGALWLADYMGAFLTAGGQAAYYYQYEPLPMYNGCGWGTFGMFNVDNNYDIKQDVAQYIAAQLLTQEWAEPVDELHTIFPASAEVRDNKGHLLVTAYAALRPDRQWALLLVNKDETSPHSVTVRFHDAYRNSNHYFAGAVTQVSFGADNYTWHVDGANGYANPDGPAVTSTQAGGKGEEYLLPRASVTVFRGAVQ
ncbi:MAG TPA: discoidin domain-containing protein [Terriglobales bacterium]|nr:discoidin domain-containing protein [Terriglobales bacterium]